MYKKCDPYTTLPSDGTSKSTVQVHKYELVVAQNSYLWLEE